MAFATRRAVNVNVARYNDINVNRPAIHSNVWRPPTGGRPIRAPGGPVGRPSGPEHLTGYHAVECNDALAPSSNLWTVPNHVRTLDPKEAAGALDRDAYERLIKDQRTLCIRP
jgi:hypothetical protein